MSLGQPGSGVQDLSGTVSGMGQSAADVGSTAMAIGQGAMNVNPYLEALNTWRASKFKR
jgi:hypothetical protein